MQTARQRLAKLAKLEQVGHRSKGMRIFTQSLDDKSVYFEDPDGPAYSAADIHELSAAGWLCLKVEYGAQEAV